MEGILGLACQLLESKYLFQLSFFSYDLLKLQWSGFSVVLVWWQGGGICCSVFPEDLLCCLPSAAPGFETPCGSKKVGFGSLPMLGCLAGSQEFAAITSVIS